MPKHMSLWCARMANHARQIFGDLPAASAAMGIKALLQKCDAAGLNPHHTAGPGAVIGQGNEGGRERALEFKREAGGRQVGIGGQAWGVQQRQQLGITGVGLGQRVRKSALETAPMPGCMAVTLAWRLSRPIRRVPSKTSRLNGL